MDVLVGPNSEQYKLCGVWAGGRSTVKDSHRTKTESS